MTAKLPVFSRREARVIGIYLRKGLNIPVKFLDNNELLAVVEDGYILSRVPIIALISDSRRGIFAKVVRGLYKVDDRVKVWIN